MKKKEIKLLVAEDDEDLRKTICELFSLFGFSVTGVSDGKEALVQIQNEIFDIVVSDIRMPNVSGFELLTKIKKENVNTPKFIAISGFTDYSIKDLYAAGVDGFFNKPIDSTQIRNCIRKSLVSAADRWRQEPHISTPNRVAKRYASLDDALERAEISFGRNGFFLQMTSNTPPVGEDVRFELIFGTSKDQFKLAGFGHVVFETNKAHGDIFNGVGIEILHLNEEAIVKISEIVKKTPPIASIPKR